MIDRIFSEEHKRHLSEAHRGCVITPEHALKISQALTGRRRTQRERDLISQGKKLYHERLLPQRVKVPL